MLACSSGKVAVRVQQELSRRQQETAAQLNQLVSEQRINHQVAHIKMSEVKQVRGCSPPKLHYHTFHCQMCPYCCSISFLARMRTLNAYFPSLDGIVAMCENMSGSVLFRKQERF